MANLSVGDMAPHFEGKTQDGTTLSLEDLKGGCTVLYFYPKDNTSGCTLEAKSLRDGKEELAARGYRIVGVSPDSERSHQNFCAKHTTFLLTVSKVCFLMLLSWASGMIFL